MAYRRRCSSGSSAPPGSESRKRSATGRADTTAAFFENLPLGEKTRTQARRPVPQSAPLASVIYVSYVEQAFQPVFIISGRASVGGHGGFALVQQDLVQIAIALERKLERLAQDFKLRVLLNPWA